MITRRWLGLTLWTVMFMVSRSAAQDTIPANTTSLTVTLPPLDLGLDAAAANPDPLLPIDYSGSLGGPDDHLSYDYYTYDSDYYGDYGPLPPIDVHDTVKKSFLHKCKCKAHQVLLDNGTCVDSSTTVEVIHPHTGDLMIFNTTDFSYVHANELQCKDGYTTGHPEHFVILPTGHLYDYTQELELPYEDYCIEHIIDVTGSPGWVASICLPDINATVRSSSLHKCRCKAHQVLRDGTCVNENTLVQVIDPHTHDPLIFNTSDFQNVISQKLKCKDGFFRDQPEHFIITASGNMYLYSHRREFLFDEYCIEHISDAGGKVNWKASICLPKPPIASCCEDGEVLAPGGSICVPYKGTESFTPPINIDQAVLGRHKLGDIVVHDIRCSGDEVKEVELNGETAILHYFLEQPPHLFFHNKYMLGEQASEYCLAARETEEGSLQYVARFCYQDTCNKSTCVRKCCNQDFHLDNGTCSVNEDENAALTYTFYQKENISLEKIVTKTPQDLHEVIGLLVHCTPDKGIGVVSLKEDEYYLLNNGSLYLPKFKKGGLCGASADSYYHIDSFCMDTYMDEDGEYSQVVMLCHEELETVKGCEAGTLLYPILMGISCVFLVLTLIVYLGVPNLRERTYGRCLISLVISILVVYITFICNYAGILVSNASCYSAAFIGHFSSLSMFFWLSVMGFDMWSTLRSSRPQSQSKKLFVRYSLYAWGFPLFFAVIALVIRLLPETEDYCHIIRPDYVNHGRGCSFNSLTTRWVYQYWVILLLTFVNMFFFVHVTITLIRNHRQTKQVLQSPNSSQTNTEKQKKTSKMWLYIKLFLVMGITWFMEIISFKDCGWIAGDIFNLLQGVLIFIITVCRADVFKKTQDAKGFKSIGSGMNTLRTRMTSDVSFLRCCGQKWSVVNSEDNNQQHMTPLESIKLNDTQTQQFL